MAEKNRQIFWGMLALAIALVLASLIAGQTIIKAKRGNDMITVTGSARQSIRSDFIIWRGRVTGTSATMPEAYRTVKRNAARVETYLNEQKIPNLEIVFHSISTTPIFEILDNGRRTNRVLYYQLTQQFEVRSDKVEEVTKLSRQVTDLIEEGVPLVSYAPEYYYTKLSELRVEMLGKATADARQRAEMIAQSAGGRIGAVRSARSGVFQITPPNSTEVSSYGIYDTSTLEKDITAVVSATFAVE